MTEPTQPVGGYVEVDPDVSLQMLKLPFNAIASIFTPWQLGIDGYDSAYGDEVASYTTSLSSSVTNYQYENGRRYHGYRAGSNLNRQFVRELAKPHFLNQLENERLEHAYHVSTLLCGGRIHLAPIGENPRNILDIGTGTGIWAMEMGEDFPSAEIIGVDLSPVQSSTPPPNVRFEIDDVESTWTYGHQFDFIHSRNMNCSIVDWPGLIKQAFNFTRPGGWVEFREADPTPYSDDGSLTEDHELRKWGHQFTDAFRSWGRDPSPGPSLQSWIEGAGFVNITQHCLKVPIGLWPREPRFKEIGAYTLIQLLDNFEGLSLAAYTRILGYTKADVQAHGQMVKRDIMNPRIHAMFDYYIVYAQKPARTPTAT
ncbi:MAG: hypothetical protein M1839_004085 [Geoglossum umbratile]|nr:MAG: hypothetical protein M1839_004085 [Geoglossum umbratile]